MRPKRKSECSLDVVTVRLTADEKASLQRQANRAGITTSELIRRWVALGPSTVAAETAALAVELLETRS